MSNKRIKLTPTVELSLLTQVSGKCPLCGKKSFYQKSTKNYKDYQIAHIYPLNPTEEEVELLSGQEQLNEDLNHPDNLIPLCKICHGKFDNPKTIEEYQALVSLKKGLIELEKQFEIQSQFEIDVGVRSVIEALYQEYSASDFSPSEFDLIELDQKLDASIHFPTKLKIGHNISDYFVIVRDKFLELEKEQPNVSDLIAAQVKTYYLKQKTLGLDRQAIFDNIVEWVISKTKMKTREPAEIVVSYFIRTCEVFE